MRILDKVIGTSLLILAAAVAAQAQHELPRVEVGIQLSTLKLHALGEGPVGVGGRFHYNFTPYLALDAEVSYFPQDPDSGAFGHTLGLAGARVGKRFGDFGVFGKFRAGVVDLTSIALSERRHPAFDVGLIYEYYATERIALRLDLGDLIIPFGDATRLSPMGVPERLGTRHTLSFAAGVAFRF